MKYIKQNRHKFINFHLWVRENTKNTITDVLQNSFLRGNTWRDVSYQYGFADTCNSLTGSRCGKVNGQIGKTQNGNQR